ncbi:MAG: Conserved repeat domain protein, partial [Parcubacteria group bacterium GW2011_GWC2_38_7]
MGVLIQKNFRFLATLLLVLLVSGIFVVVKNFSRVEAVLEDGANAIDMIGQYDDNFELDYTQGLSHTIAPNNYGLDSSTDVVVDQVNHQLFIADYDNARVVVYDLDVDNVPIDYFQDYVIGQPDFQSNGQNNPPFGAPISVEVSSDGLYLFVGWDGASASVLVYTLPIAENDATELYHFSDLDGTGCDINHIASPNDIEYVETAGNKFVLVADAGENDRVLIYEVTAMSDGLDPVYVLGQPNFDTCDSGVSTTALSNPHGVAYDVGADPDLMTDDRIFIADNLNNRVVVHDLSLAVLANNRTADYVLGHALFTESGSGSDWDRLSLSSNGGEPNGIYFDTTNNRLLVADKGNSRIVAYDTTEIVSGESGTHAMPNAEGNFNAFPQGMDYNESNDMLYFAEGNRLFVVEAATFSFNADEVFGHLWAIDGLFGMQTGSEQPNGTPNPWTFDDISFVTVDEENHRLFVGDETSGPKIMVFNLNEQNELEDFVADNILGGNSLHGNNWFFGDPGNARLTDNADERDAVFDSTTNLLYVADRYRIMVYNVATIADGEDAVYVIGHGGDIEGNSEPAMPTAGDFGVSSLAIDEAGQRLFVADALFNRVLVFDTSALADDMVAENVLGANDFVTNNFGNSCTNTLTGDPGSLAYDSVGQALFVGTRDEFCPRVMAFDVEDISNGEPATRVLGQSSLMTTGEASLDASHFIPAGLDYDVGQKRLFVTDAPTSNHNRILVFDLVSFEDGEDAVNVIGQTLFTENSTGYAQNLLNDPVDVEYIASSRLAVVADAGAARIMFFDASSTAPNAPTNFTVADSTALSIQLTWTDASDDETGFELYVREAGDEEWIEVDLGVGVDQESYTVSDLEPSTNYEFQLRSYNDGGDSDYVSVEGSTTAIIPTAPTLTAPNDAATEVDLNPEFEFSSAVDPDVLPIYYRIEFSDDESFLTTDKYFDQRTSSLGWSQINSYDSGDTANFTLPEQVYFAPGLTYYWRVRAYVLGLPSDEYSEVRSFTIADSSATDVSNIPFEDTFLTNAGLDLDNSTGAFNDGSIKQKASISAFTVTNQFESQQAVSFDADSDGDLDIARCGSGPNEFEVWMNNGSGVFSLGDSSDGGCAVSVGDVDSDGDLDVILVISTGFTIGINDGD